MLSKNLIFVFLVVLIVIIFINLSAVSFVFLYKNQVTGHASGFVNISILPSISINLTNFLIDWKAGSITPGEFNATLYTDGDNDGTVERGNWSGINVTGYTLENTGNINATIYISTNKNAHDMFAGTSATNEQYQIKVSDKETGACIGNTSIWIDVNKTSPGTKYCDHLNFLNSSDEAYVDVLLTVPFDINNIGLQTDIITITGLAAS
jgi:hypothetical protein